jgi:peroxiredoxin Q/BCP
MRLRTGDLAPELRAEAFGTGPLDLSTYRGKAVLLSFYRYASCPVCNLRVRALMQQQDTLRARGLELVAVFQSSAESIGEYVGRQDVPFPIVPDPGLDLYRRFGVEARWSGLLTPKAWLAILRGALAGFLPGRIEGPMQRVPADFIIDAQGRIALAHYGRHIDDHLEIDALLQWLDSRSAREG